MVRRGMGSDSRIGKNFFTPVAVMAELFSERYRALIKVAENVGYEMSVLKAVEEVNNRQKTILFRKFNDYFQGDVKGKTTAVWGLSFKPETDDMRDAPSLTLIRSLLDAGVNVRAYDPAAMNEAKRYLGDSIYYANDIYDAANDADALIVPTEWKEFRLPNWGILRKIMNNYLVVDGRNIYNREEIESYGFEYQIGRNKFGAENIFCAKIYRAPLLLKQALTLISTGKNNPLSRWFSGNHTFTRCFVSFKGMHRMVALVSFLRVLRFWSAVPMAEQKPAFFDFLFKFVVRIYFAYLRSPKIECLLIDVLLNLAEKIFYVIGNSFAWNGFFGQRVATGNFYCIVFQIASSHSQPHGNAFQFIFRKLPPRLFVVGIVIFHTDAQRF